MSERDPHSALEHCGNLESLMHSEIPLNGDLGDGNLTFGQVE